MSLGCERVGVGESEGGISWQRLGTTKTGFCERINFYSSKLEIGRAHV